MAKLRYSKVIESKDSWAGCHTIKVYSEGYVDHIYTIKLDEDKKPCNIIVEDKSNGITVDEFIILGKDIESGKIFI